MSDETNAKLTRYHWKLFGFLSVATFFEGYDHIALSQVLPELRGQMGIDEGEGGIVVAVINIGTILAYLLVRKADRWGRKRVLTITIAGYTIASFLSALSPNVWVFAVLQLFARIFLIGEWVVSMMYAAEEFPAAKRGLMIGLIQGWSALGSVACAGLAPQLIENIPDGWGWRSVYLIGTVPLVLLAVGRRGLKESARFVQAQAEGKGEDGARSFFYIFSTPYRKRVLQLAVIWGLTYLCTTTAVLFWKEYALAGGDAVGPHLSETQAGNTVMIGAVIAMPLVFLAGKIIDWLGRRVGAVVIFTILIVSSIGAYTVTEQGVLMVLSVAGAIFGLSAVLPVLNAYSTELFPTELRGYAFAWANNILGRVTYVVTPVIVGYAAEDFGWGPSVAVTAIGPAIALVLILTLLPETKGRSLEETSRL